MDNDQMPDRDVKGDVKNDVKNDVKGDVELARRLEAYAIARLSPSLSATTRMRAQVMAAAHRQAALVRADAGRAALAAGGAGPTMLRRSAWRRPMTALLAASLALALAVGSVAAARPGGPLYGARIWVETLTLPGSPSERAAAEVRRLQERLSEAAAATAAGDTNAAEAALAAYNDIVNEATAAIGNDPAANATLDAGVRRNIEVLTILAARVPPQARAAIQRAIDRSSSAVNGLHGQPGVDGNPNGNPGNKPAAGQTNRPPHSANPHKPTPAPVVATAKPNQGNNGKPHPTPRPKPNVSPAPNVVAPTPHPTPKSGGKPSNPPGGGKPSNPPGQANESQVPGGPHAH